MMDPEAGSRPVGADPEASGALLRASDAERETTIGHLRHAAAEGRLTFEELADRTEVTASARTRGELAKVTEDLPAPVHATPEPGSADVAGLPTRQSSVFGDVRCTGAWQVPAAGKWESLFGDVVLDLREATVTASELRIDAGTVFGDVDLLVPEGIVVEVRSRTLFGSVRQKAGAVGHPGAPRIVLTGGTFFGDVRVRHDRLRERLAERVRERRSR